jgi:hypothetical protein
LILVDPHAGFTIAFFQRFVKTKKGIWFLLWVARSRSGMRRP